jgi:hypothetical protein
MVTRSKCMFAVISLIHCSRRTLTFCTKQKLHEHWTNKHSGWRCYFGCDGNYALSDRVNLFVHVRSDHDSELAAAVERLNLTVHHKGRNHRRRTRRNRQTKMRTTSKMMPRAALATKRGLKWRVPQVHKRPLATRVRTQKKL